MFGWQTSFTNAGAIILSLLGGFLGKMVFHTAYLSYVIFVIPVFIIVAICLKKDVPVVSSRTRSGLKIDGTVIYYLIIITIFIMIYNAYATNVAMFALENQLGDTSTAGIANSVALVGGIVGGFLFGPIGKKLGKHMMTLGLFMCAMGFLLTYMAATLTVALLAAFIAGISISFFMPSVTFSAAAEIKDEYKTMGLSLVATIGSLGAFLSPIIFTNLAIALGDATTKFRFLLVGIIAVTLSVVFFIMFQVQKSTKEAV
jgi:MFS family permease